MSRLELAAKPVLQPMLDGLQTDLDADAQALLATWAYKTVLMMDAGMPRQRLWETFYPAFYQNRSPFESARIWVGARDWFESGRAAHFAATRDRQKSPESGEWLDEGARVFRAVLSVGSVIFVSTLGYDAVKHESPPFELDFLSAASKMTRIWPPSPSFAWPPAGGKFSSQEFAAFTLQP